MNKMTNQVLEALADFEGAKAVTIYMPTIDNVTPASLQENQTRFKNLIRRSIDQLDNSTDRIVIERLNEFLREKSNDTQFWQELTKSLAVFATDEAITHYHLPLEISEQTYVGTTFDTLPLYLIDGLNDRFYLFALAQHNPRLFAGDIYGLEPVAIELPQSPEEALNIDEMFSGSNTVRAGSGSMRGNPHGQGDSQHAGQEERLMYFRILDEQISKAKHIDHDLPVLLAATESEASDFRSVSKALPLLDAYISGNRTRDDLHRLHKLALQTVQDVATKNMEAVQELYEEKKGAAKATSNLREIMEAARMGRVDKLFLGLFEKSKDSVANMYDRSTSRPLYDQTDEKKSILSLVKTVIQNGGKVEALNRYMMPEKAKVAAVLRY